MNNSKLNKIIYIIITIFLVSNLIPQIDYYLRVILGENKTFFIAFLTTISVVATIILQGKIQLYYIYTFFWILFISLIRFFGKNEYIHQIYNMQLILITSILVMLYLYQNKNKEMNKRLAYIILISILISSLTSYIGLKKNPQASRSLASGDMDIFLNYSKLGIVGYGFVYGSILILPLLLYSLNLRKNKLCNNFISLLTITAIGLLIFVASYSMAIILFLLSFFLTILFNIRNKKTKAIIIFIIIIILIFPRMNFYIGEVFIKLSSMLETIPYSQGKVRDLGITIQRMSVYGGTQQRFNLINITIKTFLDKPIFGTFLNDQKDLVGGHSEFFDMLATFGIIGFLLYLPVIVIPLKVILNNSKQYNYYNSFIVTIILLSMISIFNNSFRASSFSIFIFNVAPIIPFINYNNKKEQKI